MFSFALANPQSIQMSHTSRIFPTRTYVFTAVRGYGPLRDLVLGGPRNLVNG